jgi:SOS-response transcriptional repressor LexA
MTNLATSLESIDDLTNTLHRLMDEKKITEAELARRTNIPQPTLHKILSGKTGDPRASTLKSLADFFGVTIDMLLTGSKTALAVTTTANSTKTQSVAIISWSDCLKAGKLLQTLTSTNWERWVTTEHTSTNAYALSSKPSMEPRLPKGSVLIIDHDITPEDGDLVVTHFPGTSEATLRELSLDGPSKLLAPICKNLAPDILSPDIKILGVLVRSIFQFH